MWQTTTAAVMGANVRFCFPSRGFARHATARAPEQLCSSRRDPARARIHGGELSQGEIRVTTCSTWRATGRGKAPTCGDEKNEQETVWKRLRSKHSTTCRVELSHPSDLLKEADRSHTGDRGVLVGYLGWRWRLVK